MKSCNHTNLLFYQDLKFLESRPTEYITKCNNCKTSILLKRDFDFEDEYFIVELGNNKK